MKRSLLSLLLFILIALYLTIVALWISTPDELTLNISTTAFTLAMTALYIILERRRYKKWYKSPRFRKLITSAITFVLILGNLALVNYLVFKHPTQYDFTISKVHTLSDQTAKAVKQLDEDLKFTIFSSRAYFPNIKGLLDLYQLKSNNIKIDFVDSELDPVKVKQYGIDRPNSILANYKGKSQIIYDLSELGITNALIKLQRDKNPLFYYSVGHREILLNDESKSGASFLRDSMKRSNYDLQEIVLASLGKIPSNVDGLIILGPKDGFHVNELIIIEEYVKAGGKLLVALDPNFKSDTLGELRLLLKKWGLNISNDLVVDKLNFVNGGKGKTNFLAYTTTFPASWAEKNLNEFKTGKVKYDLDKDLKGPVPVMGIWESNSQSNKGRIVAFGNSSFIVNGYTKFSPNFSLFLNSMTWMMNENHLISFNTPTVKSEPVFISRPQLGIIFYFSVLIAPFILLAGAFVNYRRRVRL
jgi:ABC-type uncharacterized transport system involved in gliding motility auxiliary subunit